MCLLRGVTPTRIAARSDLPLSGEVNPLIQRLDLTLTRPWHDVVSSTPSICVVLRHFGRLHATARLRCASRRRGSGMAAWRAGAAAGQADDRLSQRADA